jgi:hypothetical protein
MLCTVARRTQQSLDEVLERVLVDPGGFEGSEMMRTSSFHVRTLEAVLRNTQTAEKSFLQPALASTLIGGFLLGAEAQSGHVGAVICVGDGAVEIIQKDGTVQQILSTDSAITAITASMGPGPLARNAMKSSEIMTRPIALAAKDRLLISSDGLARGHKLLVSQEINKFSSEGLWMQRDKPSAAFDLLDDLAATADRLRDSNSLFEDNLSLILLEVG